jgi:hypothetical protein|tara:strand:- start:430 stop:615 length:186 start_codon:yes stop_codon:yes gene_type:complete
MAPETECGSLDGETNKSPSQCTPACGLQSIETRPGIISLFVLFTICFFFLYLLKQRYLALL